MNKRTIRALFSGLVVPVLFFGVVSLGPAHAAHIVVNDDDIETQSVVVQEKLIETLQEYVKYLQLIFIDQLETRIALLKAQINAE